MKQHYQYQPWHVKVYRQVRYRPKWIIVAAYQCLWWLLLGCKQWQSQFYTVTSRWQTPVQIWKWANVMAAIDMQHTWYLEEMVNKWRAIAESRMLNHVERRIVEDL